MPEEALVHIFGEARRTTPSILYLPNLDLWWDNVSSHSVHLYSVLDSALKRFVCFSPLFRMLFLNIIIFQAHEQLRAVLVTLLEELPSEFPILLLATSSGLPAEMDGRYQIFTERCMYVYYSCLFVHVFYFALVVGVGFNIFIRSHACIVFEVQKLKGFLL